MFCGIRNSQGQSLKESKVKFILGWPTTWRNAEEQIFISHPFLDSLSLISIPFAFFPCAGADRMLSPILLLWHHGPWPARLRCPWDFPGKNTSCYCCSITQSCLTVCDSMDYSIPGLPVPHHLLESAQVHVHCIIDAIQPSHPLMPSSLSACNLSQHQRLFQWVICSRQMTKILELQLQHKSFYWIFRVDLP